LEKKGWPSEKGKKGVAVWGCWKKKKHPKDHCIKKFRGQMGALVKERGKKVKGGEIRILSPATKTITRTQQG